MNIKQLILALSLLMVTGLSQGGIAVIINNNNNIATLSEKDAGKIFLKKKKSFTGGSEATPIDLEDPALKGSFYEEVAKKKEVQLRSYWSRMIFSGKAQPPKPAYSASEVKSLVAGDETAIGYIDEKDVDDTVKVVLTIN